jgi:hypothetical protein
MGEVTELGIVSLVAGPAFASEETLLHRLAVASGFCDGGEDCRDAETVAGWPFPRTLRGARLTADRSG